MNILIIDGNNWFRRKAETDIYGTPMRTCFYELQNKPQDKIYLVWDGYKSLAKRREIYPDYKKKRNTPGEDFFDIQKEFKKLCLLSKVTSVEVEGYEGDDVVAHLVKRFIPEVGPNNILIESNDGDFGQLGVPMTNNTARALPGHVLPYKCTVGDPSDNIKGIEGFGRGAWDKLDIEEIELIKQWIDREDTTYIENIEFSPRVTNWLKEKSNLDLIYKYRDIVDFIEIDFDLVSKNMQEGYNRPDLAEKVLENYLT